MLVYAGGDDVLAFVPVDKCLTCSRELHDKFGELLNRFTDANGASPTLSVGIAIGHFMENLEDLLEYGRAAEKDAKKVDGKNALAVHLNKRGGAPIRVASPWNDQSCAGTMDRPDKRLTRFAELIQAEAISGKLPYDLNKLAGIYKDWPGETLVQVLRQDVLRVIRDKQPRAGRFRERDRNPRARATERRRQSICLRGRAIGRPDCNGSRSSRRAAGRRKWGRLMTTTILSLTPHDPVIARDGRPFGAGQGQRMKGLPWPLPSVVAGSFRSALAKANPAIVSWDSTGALPLEKTCVYGPFPVVNDTLYLPGPATL